MNTGTIWLVIFGGMAVTYFLRASFLVLLENDNMPSWLLRGLQFSPSVVLSGLVAQLLVKEGDTVNISLSNPHIISGGIALFVALKFQNIFLTLLAGLGSLWILNSL